MIKLNENYTIAKEGAGFMLSKKVPGKDKKGNPKDSFIKKSYGTVYQALTGFIYWTVDDAESLEDVRTKVAEARNSVMEAEQEIKNTFRVEVRVS